MSDVYEKTPDLDKINLTILAFQVQELESEIRKHGKQIGIIFGMLKKRNNEKNKVNDEKIAE